MKSDIDIARAARLKPIAEVAEELGPSSADIEPYGADKAKIRLESIAGHRGTWQGRRALVTAMTPTPAGEGKST